MGLKWWSKARNVAAQEVKRDLSESAGHRDNLMDQLALERAFEDACESAAPVVVLCADFPDLAFQGRFARVSHNQLVIDLLTPRGASRAGKPLPNGSICSVAFICDGQSRVFMTQVAEYFPAKKLPATLPSVAVMFPRLVAAAEMRSSFRVPVTESGPALSIEVHHEDHTTPLRALDLSLTGMLASVADDASIDLPAESRVGIEIAFNGEVLRLAAVVVPRRQPGLYGFYFPDVFRGAHIAAPPLLRELLSSLEQQWMLTALSDED